MKWVNFSQIRSSENVLQEEDAGAFSAGSWILKVFLSCNALLQSSILWHLVRGNFVNQNKTKKDVKLPVNSF